MDMKLELTFVEIWTYFVEVLGMSRTGVTPAGCENKWICTTDHNKMLEFCNVDGCLFSMVADGIFYRFSNLLKMMKLDFCD